jgi:hypothetical protein
MADDDQAKLEAAIKADPMANQRDAAKKCGVKLGTYQRTRNRLIANGEIGKPTKTPEQQITDAIQQLTTATKALTHDEKIKIGVEILRKIGVAASQVADKAWDRLREEGAVTDVVFDKPKRGK